MKTMNFLRNHRDDFQRGRHKPFLPFLGEKGECFHHMTREDTFTPYCMYFNAIALGHVITDTHTHQGPSWVAPNMKCGCWRFLNIFHLVATKSCMLNIRLNIFKKTLYHCSETEMSHSYTYIET